MKRELSPSQLHGLVTLAPEEAAARLVQLKEALPTSNDPDALLALAKALPRKIEALEPEVALLLHDVALALVPFGPTIPEDILDLEPRLRVLWLRVALSVGDEAWLRKIEPSLLLNVLTGWALDAVPSPLPLIERLTSETDARLRDAALRSLPGAVQHLAIKGQDAFTCLATLARDVDETIRCEALRMLAKVWLLGLSPAAIRTREDRIREALHAEDPLVVSAAIGATSELGERRWLAELLLADVSAATRAEALEALGPLAEPDDLYAALALAEEDPLRFGPVVRRFLLEAHRHGVFLRDEHLPSVLRIYDAHHAWTGEELVRVTYIARGGLVRMLQTLPASDPRWIRRASILAASLGTGAHRVLADLLEALAPGDAPDTSSLPIAAALVDAAARSPEFHGEELILRWLDTIPETAIPALRVKGGAKTAARLRAIVLDPFTTQRSRKAAMDVLWALADDRRQLLTDLVTQIGPHESGLLESKYLSQRDATAAELLGTARTAGGQAIEPFTQLKIYCESGDIRFLPDVTRLFREVFRTCVRKALAGDFTVKRLVLPELEQLVFRYGRHLVKDGRSVRRWVEAGPETGRDLVLLLLTDWLTTPEGAEGAPSDPICVALLEAAARHSPDGAYLRFIEPFWRRGDVNVRRAAIEALVAAGNGARGLELSLGRLAAAEGADPRILTQALDAARTLRASWAEPIVGAVLRRPEMAVKMEAAEALAAIGTSRSVPALVHWLGRHDNESFRSSLRRALERAAGPSLVAVLVDALEGLDHVEGETRSKELLRQALSGQITAAAVLRLARSTEPAHRELVEACVQGQVAVVGVSAEDLAAQLYRAKLRPITVKLDPARQLRVSGFTPEAAKALVLARTPKLDADTLPVVRMGLADWIAWLSSASLSQDDDLTDAVALVLDAVDRAHAGAPGAASPRVAEHVPLLLSLIGTWRDRLEPDVVASFIERCMLHGSSLPRPPLRLRAIALLRALAPSAKLGGLRRWRLLGRLSAVRTAADLERCLVECRLRPDVAAESATLLLEALSIPTPTKDSPDELVKVHEDATSWYRLDEPARLRWVRDAIARRPLDLPPVPAPPDPPAKPPFSPASRTDLDELLVNLETGPLQERERAAERILGWPDAHEAWGSVMAAYLDGQVEVSAAGRATLARTLTTWPTAASAEARKRLAALVPHLTEVQLRSFVPAFLAAWDAGDAFAGDLLQGIGQERLLALSILRARAKNYTLVRLLARRTAPSVAMESLVALLLDAAPREAAHLTIAESAKAPEEAGDPVDPIDGKNLHELLALIDTKGVEKGLAVRAVHALTTFKERATEPLARLALDRRPQVRGAALRALRMVASRERTLEATALVLKMETRRDVALSLMASLGHGKHEPSLPGLLDRLTDRDYRIRQGAHDALRAWGRDVIPAIRHASRRARPDRRPLYAKLIEELE